MTEIAQDRDIYRVGISSAIDNVPSPSPSLPPRERASVCLAVKNSFCTYACVCVRARVCVCVCACVCMRVISSLRSVLSRHVCDSFLSVSLEVSLAPRSNWQRSKQIRKANTGRIQVINNIVALSRSRASC